MCTHSNLSESFQGSQIILLSLNYLDQEQMKPVGHKLIA